MKTHKSMALCALAVVVLTSVSSDAGADRRKLNDESKSKGRTFSVSMEYTGRVGDDMVIGGVRYRIGKNVPVYVVGQGATFQGVTVTRQSIFLAGEMRGSDAIVKSVIVRPATTTQEGLDNSMNVKLMPAGSPQ